MTTYRKPFEVLAVKCWLELISFQTHRIVSRSHNSQSIEIQEPFEA